MKTNEIKIQNLRVCHLTEPLGFAMEKPVFSWTVEEAAGRQLGASLEICAKGETVYDSGENPSADSLGWTVPLRLLPRMRYDYTLRIGTADGQYAEASSFFETGKRDEPWTALGSVLRRIGIPPCCAGAFPAKSGRARPDSISAAWGSARPISTARRSAASTWPPAIMPTTSIWLSRPMT